MQERAAGVDFLVAYPQATAYVLGGLKATNRQQWQEAFSDSAVRLEFYASYENWDAPVALTENLISA